jgi:hypothetical protein
MKPGPNALGGNAPVGSGEAARELWKEAERLQLEQDYAGALEKYREGLKLQSDPAMENRVRTLEKYVALKAGTSGGGQKTGQAASQPVQTGAQSPSQPASKAPAAPVQGAKGPGSAPTAGEDAAAPAAPSTQKPGGSASDAGGGVAAPAAPGAQKSGGSAQPSSAGHAWVLSGSKVVRGKTPAPVEGGEVRAELGENSIEMLLARPYGVGVYASKDYKNPQRLHARYTWTMPREIHPGGRLVVPVTQQVLSFRTGNWAGGFGVAVSIENRWEVTGRTDDGQVVKPNALGIGSGRPEWMQKDLTVTYERDWLWNTDKPGGARIVIVTFGGLGTHKVEYRYEWKPVSGQADRTGSRWVDAADPDHYIERETTAQGVRWVEYNDGKAIFRFEEKGGSSSHGSVTLYDPSRKITVTLHADRFEYSRDGKKLGTYQGGWK